jgi:hypothetical protein
MNRRLKRKRKETTLKKSKRSDFPIGWIIFVVLIIVIISYFAFAIKANEKTDSPYPSLQSINKGFVDRLRQEEGIIVNNKIEPNQEYMISEQINNT